MDHSTVENLLLIKANDGVWSEKERKEIIARAVEIYLQKRRKTKITRPEQAATSSTADAVTVDISSSSSSYSESNSDDSDSDFDWYDSENTDDL